MDLTSPSGLYPCLNSFLLMDKIPWARQLTEGRVYLGSQCQRDKTLLWKKSRQNSLELPSPTPSKKQRANWECQQSQTQRPPCSDILSPVSYTHLSPTDLHNQIWSKYSNAWLQGTSDSSHPLGAGLFPPNLGFCLPIKPQADSQAFSIRAFEDVLADLGCWLKPKLPCAPMWGIFLIILCEAGRPTLNLDLLFYSQPTSKDAEEGSTALFPLASFSLASFSILFCRRN